jgi:hypothetical protein
MTAPSETGRQLCEQTERADATPAVITGEHEDERQRSDGNRPEDTPGVRPVDEAEADQSEKDE